MLFQARIQRLREGTKGGRHSVQACRHLAQLLVALSGALIQARDPIVESFPQFVDRVLVLVQPALDLRETVLSKIGHLMTQPRASLTH